MVARQGRAERPVPGSNFSEQESEPVTLRPYQDAAIAALYAHLGTKDTNPLIVLPTGSGKSPVMASICKDAVVTFKPASRVLILAHVKELITQTVDKITQICPEIMVGIYSAGLGQRDTLAPVIVAGIQSVYDKANEIGRFDLVMVDEVHLVKTDGEGRYVSLLNRLKEINPNIRIIGLTATPFRLDSGHIAAPENIFNEVCYEASVSDLIAQGYLCPLVSKAAKNEGDFTAVHTRLGEFVAAEVESIVAADPVVDAACNELMNETSSRRSVLVFAQSVAHGGKVTEKLKSLGQRADSVFGDTLDFERDQLIEDFKNGRLKYLVNVGVLTTGFDAPNIDCVAILRPTMSPGLYYQMVGRGFRLHPSKTNCMILDFGGNVERHGPVDLIQPGRSSANRANEGPPGKMCMGCRAYCSIGYQACPHCRQAFAPRENKPREITHNAQAHGGGVLAGQETITRYEVQNIDYSIHRKLMDDPENPGRKTQDLSKPPTMKVEYEVGFNKYKSQWVCFEHRGFALDKAYDWWNRMISADAGVEFPRTVANAVELCRSGAVRIPSHITVKSIAGKPFDEIIEYEFAPVQSMIPTDAPEQISPQFSDACMTTCACTVHEKWFFANLDGGMTESAVLGSEIQLMLIDSDMCTTETLMLHEAGNNATGWRSADWWGFRRGLPPVEEIQNTPKFDFSAAPVSEDDIPF
jgi:DNA repair protein RadD